MQDAAVITDAEEGEITVVSSESQGSAPVSFDT